MKKNFNNLFRSGMTRQVLFGFLLVSLVPLVITSWLSYREAYDQLYQKTERSLQDVTELEAEHIRDTFNGALISLGQESARLSTSNLLMTLEQALVDSGKSAGEFVESYRWVEMVDQLAGAADLTTFWREHAHSDIYLIDAAGNILFSVTRGDDLGRNLFQGTLAQSRLAQTAQKTLTTGQTLFSDLEFYAPKGDILSGFILAPVIAENGSMVGLMAFQMAGKQIQNLLSDQQSDQKTGNRYLLGEDLTLRTPGGLGDNFPILTQPIKTDITSLWQTEHQSGSLNVGEHGERVRIYTGPTGEEVIGLHEDIEIAGTHWAYFNEVATRDALAATNSLARITLILIVSTVLLMSIFSVLTARRIVRPIVEIAGALSKVGQGKQQQKIEIRANHEIKALVQGFNSMLQNLQKSERKDEEQRWLQEGVNNLNECVQGDQDLTQLASSAISFLCQYLGVLTGAFYVVRNQQVRFMAGYAFSEVEEFRREFALGEGFVGQAAHEKQTLEISDVPEDYLLIRSAQIEAPPKHVTVVPLTWAGETIVVLEFGALKGFDHLQNTLLSLVAPALAIATQTALTRQQTIDLLKQTQNQSEELRVREEELRDNNTLLEEQASALQVSEELLRQNQAELEEKNEQLQTQQEELRVSNEELESRAQELKVSRDQIELKNRELHGTQADLEKQAQELKLSSRYKSEFLANMSHELRTPLNSMLILSRMLAENQAGNLTEKQVSFSQTIYEAGNDLLDLINNILDLSKIEAGQMDTEVETIIISNLIVGLEKMFCPLAEEKGLEFKIKAEGVPEQLSTDAKKLSQIIKNLLSNAFKFTSMGCVELKITLPEKGVQLKTPTLQPENTLAFAVSDSGPGIPKEKFESIFEAFQQADGTTNRKYGGTGLGLSISRQFASLLGGEIHLQSEKGVGSTFTLYLPQELLATSGVEKNDRPATTPSLQQDPLPKGATDAMGVSTVDADKMLIKDTALPDDRHNLTSGERSILIIEDDVRFAEILIGLARHRGFKVLAALDGETGLYLADYFQPSGIMLDINLPGIDGWRVLEQLKESGRSRHIPVHVISANEFTTSALKKGAIGYLTKPVSMDALQNALTRIEDVVDRPVKQVLLIEDNPRQLQAMQELIGDGDVVTLTAATGAEALQQLNQNKIDCIVLDYGLPDMSGLQLLETLRDQTGLERIPVIIYTGKELEPQERAKLENYSQSLIIKSAHSDERLLDDTTLFLHRVEKNLPEEKQKTLRMLHDREALFDGRKALLVDDDMRNIYALSAILQEKNMQVLVAKNGIEALEQLATEPDIAIVLMDIMMPEMDGYEACRRIRLQEKFTELPIIALTAKAMKGDRVKCIEAGASDYLAKPVEVDKLMSMMRVWLYR